MFQMNLSWTNIVKLLFKIVSPYIHTMFQPRKTQYELRGMSLFTKTKSRSNIKHRCISVVRVNLWNSFENYVKMCNTLNRFKILKKKMYNKYKSEACMAVFTWIWFVLLSLVLFDFASLLLLLLLLLLL